MYSVLESGELTTALGTRLPTPISSHRLLQGTNRLLWWKSPSFTIHLGFLLFNLEKCAPTSAHRNRNPRAAEHVPHWENSDSKTRPAWDTEENRTALTPSPWGGKNTADGNGPVQFLWQQLDLSLHSLFPSLHLPPCVNKERLALGWCRTGRDCKGIMKSKEKLGVDPEDFVHVWRVKWLGAQEQRAEAQRGWWCSSRNTSTSEQLRGDSSPCQNRRLKKMRGMATVDSHGAHWKTKASITWIFLKAC